MMLWLTAQQFMPFQSRISSWQGKWNLASQLWNGMKGNTRGHHFTFTFQFGNEWIRKAELSKSTFKLNEMKTCGHKFTFTFQVENGWKRTVEYDKSNLKKKMKGTFVDIISLFCPVLLLRVAKAVLRYGGPRVGSMDSRMLLSAEWYRMGRKDQM